MSTLNTKRATVNTDCRYHSERLDSGGSPIASSVSIKAGLAGVSLQAPMWCLLRSVRIQAQPRSNADYGKLAVSL